MFVKNTMLLKNQKKREVASEIYSINDFIDPGGFDQILTKEELEFLEYKDIIYIWDRVPILDDEKYLDYNNFYQAVKNAWLST